MSGTENNEKNSWLEILFENNPTSLTKYNKALAYVQQHFMEVIILIFNKVFLNLDEFIYFENVNF